MKFKTYSLSLDEIRGRIAGITTEHAVNEERSDVLKLVLSAIDLTTLEATDTDEKVRMLCRQACGFRVRKAAAPNVAAVCVYPPFARLVSEELKGSGIRTVCVATAFPSGQAPLAVKLQEVAWVVDQGAEEVDMVISRGKFLEGKISEVSEEISAVKKACGRAHLKVILETGELESVDNIRKASEIAILAGADFLKTSTGKVQPAATPEAFVVMLDTIKEYFDATGIRIGIKAAGGIADADSAITYYLLLKSILGPEWLNPELFRIGASRLAENVFSEL